MTTLAQGELVTAIELPRATSRRGAVHVRRTRRRGHDLAAVTLACAVGADGVTRLAYGSLGPRPVLVVDETGLLADPAAPDPAKAQLLESLFVGASPSARSMRASPEYRLAMLHVLGLRAVANRHRAPCRRDRSPVTANQHIDVTVNGRARSIEVAPHHTLLDVLRDDLGLTGTKECCLVGECGACTVLVDEVSVDSCLMLAVEADGASVTTVEGLAAADRLHPLQQAFLDTGAAQCGFCIPGSAGLRAGAARPEPAPDAGGGRGGPGRQPLPVRRLRARSSRPCWLRPQPGRGDRDETREGVGASPARVGGFDRVTGRQAYVADLHIEDALHVKLVTLDCAGRGSIGIDTSAALAVPGVRLVITAADLPIANATLRTAVRGPAGPRRRRDEVPRRAGRGHRGGDTGRRGGGCRVWSASITRSCRRSSRSPLPWTRRRRSSRIRRSAPADPLAATNVLREHQFGWGDVDAASAEADVVVEGTYTFPMVTQFAIEPHGFIAAPDGDGIAVWSSIQHPNWLQRVIAGAARPATRQGSRLLARPGRWLRGKAAREVRAAAWRSWPSGRAGRFGSC